MKKNKKILIGIIVILIIIISFVFINSNKINKSSFIIKITSDYQSSGGTERKYEANLTFVDNKLVSGSQSYVVIPSPMCSGGPGDCGGGFSCIVENGQWVDATNKGKCNIPPDISNISLTKEGIEQQIKRGEIKPLNSECTHGDLCYEILDLSHINDGKPGYSGGSMGDGILR